MKILLIDDEKLAVEAMYCTITWEEYGIKEVFKAYSVKQAKEICEKNEIDITFCDIEMPRESGLDFARWIREGNYQMVLIFLTSYAEFSYAKQAISLGVQDYLLKPIEKKEMRQALEKAVRTAQSHEKKRKTSKRILELGGESSQMKENVKIVTKYIEEHLQEPLTRESLAALVFLNSDYLSRVFKKYLGLSLMDYVAKERMERAKQMLRESSLSISEIALEAGYSNTAYFTKIFKKYMDGMTPRAYRKEFDL